MPSSRITVQICSRSSGTPCPEPYCITTFPWWVTRSEMAWPTTSSGRPEMLGMPPARETTSGRDATAKRARISEAVMPAVRAAYLST